MENEPDFADLNNLTFDFDNFTELNTHPLPQAIKSQYDLNLFLTEPSYTNDEFLQIESTHVTPGTQLAKNRKTGIVTPIPVLLTEDAIYSPPPPTQSSDADAVIRRGKQAGRPLITVKNPREITLQLSHTHHFSSPYTRVDPGQIPPWLPTASSANELLQFMSNLPHFHKDSIVNTSPPLRSSSSLPLDGFSITQTTSHQSARLHDLVTRFEGAESMKWILLVNRIMTSLSTNEDQIGCCNFFVVNWLLWVAIKAWLVFNHRWYTARDFRDQGQPMHCFVVFQVDIKAATPPIKTNRPTSQKQPAVKQEHTAEQPNLQQVEAILKHAIDTAADTTLTIQQLAERMNLKYFCAYVMYLLFHVHPSLGTIGGLERKHDHRNANSVSNNGKSKSATRPSPSASPTTTIPREAESNNSCLLDVTARLIQNMMSQNWSTFFSSRGCVEMCSTKQTVLMQRPDGFMSLPRHKILSKLRFSPFQPLLLLPAYPPPPNFNLLFLYCVAKSILDFSPKSSHTKTGTPAHCINTLAEKMKPVAENRPSSTTTTTSSGANFKISAIYQAVYQHLHQSVHRLTMTTTRENGVKKREIGCPFSWSLIEELALESNSTTSSSFIPTRMLMPSHVGTNVLYNHRSEIAAFQPNDVLCTKPGESRVRAFVQQHPDMEIDHTHPYFGYLYLISDCQAHNPLKEMADQVFVSRPFHFVGTLTSEDQKQTLRHGLVMRHRSISFPGHRDSVVTFYYSYMGGIDRGPISMEVAKIYYQYMTHQDERQVQQMTSYQLIEFHNALKLLCFHPINGFDTTIFYRANRQKTAKLYDSPHQYRLMIAAKETEQIDDMIKNLSTHFKSSSLSHHNSFFHWFLNTTIEINKHDYVWSLRHELCKRKSWDAFLLHFNAEQLALNQIERDDSDHVVRCNISTWMKSRGEQLFALNDFGPVDEKSTALFYTRFEETRSFILHTFIRPLTALLNLSLHHFVVFSNTISPGTTKDGKIHAINNNNNNESVVSLPVPSVWHWINSTSIFRGSCEPHQATKFYETSSLPTLQRDEKQPHLLLGFVRDCSGDRFRAAENNKDLLQDFRPMVTQIDHKLSSMLTRKGVVQAYEKMIQILDENKDQDDIVLSEKEARFLAICSSYIATEHKVDHMVEKSLNRHATTTTTTTTTKQKMKEEENTRSNTKRAKVDEEIIDPYFNLKQSIMLSARLNSLDSDRVKLLIASYLSSSSQPITDINHLLYSIQSYLTDIIEPSFNVKIHLTQ